MQDVGDGNAGVAIGEMGVVTASANRNPEPVPRQPLEQDLMVLPCYSASALEKRQIVKNETSVKLHVS